MSFKTPLEMLYHWQDTSPNTVFLRQPVDADNLSQRPMEREP